MTTSAGRSIMTQLAKLSAPDRIAAVVAAVSACTLLVELISPHELAAPTPDEPSPAELHETANDVVPVGPLADYLSVSERPLFTPDRRPFVMVVEAVPVLVGPRVEFELTAVIIASATQLALLRSNMTPTVQRVPLNHTIDGWTLAEVRPDSVLMRQDEATVTVPLRPDLGAARSGQAVRLDSAGGAN